MKRATASWLIPILCLLMLCSCGKSPAEQWQEQYDLGVRYLSEGNYEEAIIAFTAAIEIDPNRAEAYVSRGNAYAASGDTEENLAAALADYEAALDLDETLVDAWLGKADIYIRQGNYEEAVKILQEALESTRHSQSIRDRLTEVENSKYIDSGGHDQTELDQMEQGIIGQEAEFVRTKGAHYDSNGALSYPEEYEYADEGYLERYTCISSDGKVLEMHEYDKSGNIVVRDTGDGVSENELVYEDDGQIALSKNPGGWWSEYTYNGGVLASKTSYLSDGGIMGIDEFSYDDSGKIVEVKNYNYVVGDASIDYLSWVYHIDYNNQNQATEIEISYKGRNTTIAKFSYDNNGNLTRVERVSADGATISTLCFEYELIQKENTSSTGIATPADLLMKFAGIITIFH